MATTKEQDVDLDITRFEYGDMERPQKAFLQLRTGKHYDGGLRSSASVFWVGRHTRSQCIGIAGSSGGDFSARSRVNPTVRATQKAIDNQHANVFTPEFVAQLTADAKAHYAEMVSAGIDGFKNIYPRPSKDRDQMTAGERMER